MLNEIIICYGTGTVIIVLIWLADVVVVTKRNRARKQESNKS